MKNKMRVGVVGVGQMGMYHARIYNNLPEVDLVALCEYDESKHKELREQFNCEVYKDYKEMLSSGTLDAVSIVLPDNMHREAVEIAVENDLHILLEKPLASELVDAKAIYEIAKDYNKVFTVGFLLRHDPRFSMIKDRLDSGELGEIIHMYCRRNSPIYGPKRYIGASDLSMHVMIHDIDYVNWFMGCQPVSVTAKSRSVLLKDYGMNDVIYAIVTYENGAIACLEACWTLPENSPTIIDDKVELVATKGVAYVDSCDQGVRFVTGEGVQYPDSRHWYEVNGEIAGDLSEEVRAFVNDVAYNRVPIVSVKEAYDASRVVDAIERSIKENKEVTV